MKTSSRTDMREAIMDTATRTVMTDGLNALSFRDLATEHGIKSASVHYHFKTKGDLATAIVDRFRTAFVERTEPLTELSFDEAMDGYIKLFRAAFDGGNRMCLGGMMAAEFTALPDDARQGLVEFVDAHKAFLKTVIQKKNKDMPWDRLDARASAIFSALEGAQLIVKGLGGKAAAFDEIVASYRAAGLFD